jgi:hypothetical protein
MLRMPVTAALVFLTTSAFAQFMEPVEDLKFGTGCISPMSTFAARLGACAILDTKSRIWCPNGQIFDRRASEYEYIPSSYVVRAICGLDQVL